MSTIADIYNSLNAIVSTALTGYVKLANPYSLEENASLLLNKSYGLGVLDGSNTERLIGGKRSYQRTFSIPIINLVSTTVSNSEAHATIEKNILLDHDKVFKAIELDSDLSGTCSRSVAISDGGLEFVTGEREKFLLIEMIIEAEYFLTL